MGNHELSTQALLHKDPHLRALLSNDRKGIEALYAEFLSRIEAYVVKNSGTQDEAKDLFQEGLLIFFKNASADGFHLDCSFFTYLYSVCHHLWLKFLEKKGRLPVTSYPDHELKDMTDIVARFSEKERDAFFQEKLRLLSEKCRLLLTLSMEGLKQRDIARLTGYANENVVKKEKHECKQKLIALLKADPRWKEFLE